VSKWSENDVNEPHTTDRWALVLGVTGGSGAAIARAVAEDPGLNIFGIHRGNWPDSARALADDVRRRGRRVELVVADAGTAEGAVAGAGGVLERIGPRSIKLLVHAIANASVGRFVTRPEDDDRLDQRRIEKSFNSMAHSFVYWTQALVDRDLLAPGARLLGLSNPMDDAVVRGTAVIAATKAALGAYVRHLAHELGPAGHRVNLLKFGAVTTQAVKRTFGTDGVDRLRSVLEQAIPARRLCTAEEVGQLVSLLAGDRCSWFNGATIDFTGGEFQGLMNVLLNNGGRAP
jgi:NAD(P)-dependent dehydrogenase (short-subunit alcohol dehydrogenase family)